MAELDSDQEGSSKENAIVLSDEEEARVDTELVTVHGSPLKVLAAAKYRNAIEVLDSPEVKLEATFDDGACGTVRKKLKFIPDDPVSSDEDSSQPVYEHPPSKYSAERIKILLQPDETKVCRVKPTAVARSASYVVDVRSLQNQDDIKKDEFGIWKYSGSHPQAFKVYQEEDGYTTVEKCCEGASGTNVVLLRRLHCTHPSNTDFKRLICFLSDASNRPHHLCLVVYHFPPGFTPTLASHGNAKEKKPFYPTWPSTLDEIKKECVEQGPKATVEHLSSVVGGVIGASASGQLPRDEKQVTNMRKRKKLRERCGGPSADADDLFVIMQRARTEGSKFVRGIRAAPDPAIIITDDCQLNDMNRFCTSSSEFGILTIDPTFSLGEFDVTPVTYRHLLLETKRNKNTPVFLGPVLLHYRKTFATYLFFASSLVGLSRQLEGVRAFGTDGEEALGDAFAHEFGFSQRLTCFIHVRRNLKDKLAECNVPVDLSQKILDDVFGKKLGSVFIEGIVDAPDDRDFQSKLEALVQSWRNCDLPSVANLEGFIEYFMANKVSVIRDTMLRSIREECGLGCPPDIFTTNASESVNAVLKRKVDYKRNELPEFIDKVKEVVQEQQREVERAVIGRGKYRFREQYCYLEVSESKWFTMNTEQRSKHLSKVQSTQVSEANENCSHFNALTDHPASSETNIPGQTSVTSSLLSVDLEGAAQRVNIPLKCLEGIWAKASRLISDDKAIVPAPGQDPEARMVLSYSGKVPHMVTPRKGGDFSCDSSCPNWKAMGICAHSVAVAEVNKKLPQFLSAKKRKKSANVTSLLTANMPKGRGRKGGTAPRSKKPTQPVTARIEMSVPSTPIQSSSTTSQPMAISNAQGFSFAPGPAASSFNMVQSPVYGTLVQSPMYGTSSMYPMYPMCQPFRQDAMHGMGYPFQASPLSPFTLCFITGNIATCIGCKNKYPKSPQAPYDLCIKHQEWRQFVSPSTATPQSKFGNVYYHCNLECIWMRCPNFLSSDLQVPPELIENLSPIHKQHLLSVFGLNL